MNNIAQQVELLFVNPAMIKEEKTLILGHFTSPVFYKDYNKTTLTIQSDGYDIQDICVNSDFEQEIIPCYRSEPELEFYNKMSLNDLIRSVKLKCYHTLPNENIIAQIIFFRVPNLKDDQYSYIFMGYADKKNNLVKKHSQVFFTENGKVKNGGDAPHVVGSNFGSVLTQHYSFGFGQNLKMKAVSPKSYLDGMKKCYDMLNEAGQENNHVLKVVFKNDPEYRFYLTELHKIYKEKNINMSAFWQSEAESEQSEKISYEIVKSLMKKKESACL